MRLDWMECRCWKCGGLDYQPSAEPLVYECSGCGREVFKLTKLDRVPYYGIGPYYSGELPITLLEVKP